MNFIADESAAKLRGAYYTPAPIARFLARWVMEARPQRLLEPGCGDGAFFEAVGQVGGGAGAMPSILGIEIDGAEAEKTSRRASRLRLPRARVVTGDYLEWSLENLRAGPQFDGVLGNPPFIRYQYLDEQAQQNAERLFAAYGLAFTRHTNAWVPFVVAAIGQLRPGGRLGMVVPSELLHVLHSQSLRDYLLRTCARVLIVDPQELWFEDALQGVVLVLAEKRAEAAGAGEARARLAILPVEGPELLAQAPGAAFDEADFVDGASLSGKWMSLLLSGPERSALAAAVERPEVRRFADVAEVDVGIVTGANKFFLVDDELVERHGLRRFARPMFGRSEHVRGVVYDERTHAENRGLGYPTNFLDFGKAAFGSLPAGARAYIRAGEREELHRRYKCRIREPWYGVPSVWASPIGMLKRSHDFPRLVRNDLGAYTTDTSYRIKPLAGSAVDRLVYSFVNSLTALSAELEGRHYGGGVLELVPSEIERLLVPLPARPKPDVRALDDRFRRGEPFEEILRSQDATVFESLGLDRAAGERIYSAWDRLRRRRQRTTTTVPDEAA